jgi:hypothetical protein
MRFSALVLLAATLSLSAAAQTRAASSGDSSSKPHAASHVPDPGSLSGNLYRNSSLGFTCSFPFGWVDRTADMQQDDDAATSVVLLAVFEHPPEATAESINSSIVIAAESVAAYPGIKTAADYFGPIAEAATKQEMKQEAAPYDFTVGTVQLVRGDFSRPRGSQMLYQSSLVIIRKKFILSFTFLAASQQEIEDLIGGLHLQNEGKPGPKK